MSARYYQRKFFVLEYLHCPIIAVSPLGIFFLLVWCDWNAGIKSSLFSGFSKLMKIKSKTHLFCQNRKPVWTVWLIKMVFMMEIRLTTASNTEKIVYWRSGCLLKEHEKWSVITFEGVFKRRRAMKRFRRNVNHSFRLHSHSLLDLLCLFYSAVDSLTFFLYSGPSSIGNQFQIFKWFCF